MASLVATDLDGTLLGAGGVVTDRTARTLVALEEAGVRVVFVTGRPLRWMADLWQHVGDHGTAICSNGGIVYDARTHEVLLERTIPPSALLEVAGRLRESVPGSTFALEKSVGGAVEPGFVPSRPWPDDVTVAPLEEIVDDRVVKLLARHPTLGPEEYWQRVEAEVGSLVTTTWSALGALVEMSAVGVTKASTLALLCDELGVPASEVVAFGDMPNDLPMLAWAGTSYAMANAHPSVLEAAGRRAPRHDEDGVAEVVEQLFGLTPQPRPDEPSFEPAPSDEPL